jgi:mono/diheme cytochrome c family protein
MLNSVLLLLFAASLALHWVVRRDPTLPNREFIPEMAHTARYNAFSPNGNFRDGKTLQAPESGTIPRDYLPLHYRANHEDALRAGEELANPLSSADARAIERGTAVFANFCQPCHGASGRGDGPVALRGFPAPPSLLAERAVKMKDGQVFHILTYGQKNMPSYASQLSREDRWKVILFVRSLQNWPTPHSSGGQP